MHANESLGTLERSRDMGYRQGGRVGCQDRIRTDNLLRLAQQLALQAQILEDRFDDQIRARQGGVVRARHEP
ncbi:hypothetical protein D3C78_1960760 [compost metagenome]